MQIHLKQPEIELALRQFINQQGISLVGKTVEIAFTSGRKDNGLSAELTIEEVTSIPEQRVIPPVQAVQATGDNEPSNTEQSGPVKATSLFN